MRVSTESNDLNSTRVDRILLLGRPRTHSRRREFFKKPPFKPTFKKIRFRSARLTRPSRRRRRRARGYECRLATARRRGTSFSKRTDFQRSTESLGDFELREPSMDLKFSQRQLEILFFKIERDAFVKGKKGTQRLYSGTRVNFSLF